MRRSSIVLWIIAIIFALIISISYLAAIPQPIGSDPTPPGWTIEANEYHCNYLTNVFLAAGVPGSVVLDVVAEARVKIEEIAVGTDNIVHAIDLRVGMALV